MDRFLVDNVTLSKMRPELRGSQFMQQRCRIPSEVLHEAAGLHDLAALTALEYKTTVEVLTQVARVVSTLTAKEKLLDLYHNEGNGDVFLLAVALAEKNDEEKQLWADPWIIATDDNGLSRKAAELQVPTCTSQDLITLISAGSTQRG